MDSARLGMARVCYEPWLSPHGALFFESSPWRSTSFVGNCWPGISAHPSSYSLRGFAKIFRSWSLPLSLTSWGASVDLALTHSWHADIPVAKGVWFLRPICQICAFFLGLWLYTLHLPGFVMRRVVPLICLSASSRRVLAFQPSVPSVPSVLPVFDVCCWRWCTLRMPWRRLHQTRCTDPGMDIPGQAKYSISDILRSQMPQGHNVTWSRSVFPQVFLNIFDLASALSIPNSMLCNTMLDTWWVKTSNVPGSWDSPRFNTLGAFHAAIEAQRADDVWWFWCMWHIVAYYFPAQ